MKTAVQSTSLNAYRAITDDGTLSNQEAEIMAVIKPGHDYSLREIEALTGIGINAVSGRVNGLKAKRILEHADNRCCKVTGRTIHPVRLPIKSETRQSAVTEAGF